MSDEFDDPELDRRLADMARAARETASVDEHEVDRALAAVRSGSSTMGVQDPPDRRPWHRGVVWLGVAASLLALVVGIVAIRRVDDDQIASVPAVTTSIPDTMSPAPSTTTIAPSTTTTTIAPSTTTIPSTTSTTSPPSTTTTLPAAPPPLTDEELIESLDGTAWEAAGIGRSCVRLSLICTQVAIGPGGEPVSFDPVTETLTRHVREDGEFATIPIPDEFDPITLLAVGPDEIAYVIAPGEADESDVYAVSLAAEDAGQVLERFPGVIPLGDSDIFPAPAGLVSSGWYNPGPRPAADAEVLVEWIDRDPADTRPTGVEHAWFDDLGLAAGVDDREWVLDGRGVTPEQPGSSQVLATFDGGFIAVYSETTGDLRAEVIRGWPDGSVEYWQLPRSWTEIGSPTPEPMGTILLPVGERFIRIGPFAERTADLPRIDVDVETGVADVTELNAHLAGLPVGQPPLGLGPVALADAIARPVSAPSLRTVSYGPVSDTGTEVTVTTEREPDDSGYGTRLVIVVGSDGRSVESVTWSQTCRRDRGHQDYRAEYCV